MKNSDLHPIGRLADNLGISRYELAKRSDIPIGALNNMVYRNIKVDDIKIGAFIKLANGSGLTLGEVYGRLKEYESKIK